MKKAISIFLFLILHTSVLQSEEDYLTGAQINEIFNKNLKKDHKYFLDSDLLHKIQSFMKKWPSKFDRFKNCPMLSNDSHDIMERLLLVSKKLKGSKCDSDKNKDVVEGLTSTLDNFDKFMTDKLELPYDASITDKDTKATKTTESDDNNNQYLGQEQVEDTSEMLKLLANISRNEDCAYDIRKNGLLPVLSDIITNVSQLGLMVPTYGLTVAGGGAALGTSIKILHGIFKSKFDWKNEDDRKDYIHLMCTFYDTRTKMLELGLMEIPNQSIELGLKMSEELLDTLRSYQKDLERRQKVVEEKKVEHLDFKIGKAKIKFLKEIPKIKVELKEAIDGTFNNYQIVRSIKEIRDLLEAFSMEGSNIPIMEVVEEIRRKLLDFKFSPWMRKIVITNYLNKVEQIEINIRSEMDDTLKEWVEQDTYKEFNLSYLETKKFLTEMYKEIESKEKAFKKTVSRKKYSSKDDGSHDEIVVFEKYNQILESIFGPKGLSAFEFFKKEGQKKMAVFVDKFYKFEDKYLIREQSFDDLDEGRKNIMCNTARFLRKTYREVESYTETAIDYLYTNAGIFHEAISKYDTFLLIPVRKSARRKILDQYFSFTAAKKELTDIEDRSQIRVLSKWKLKYSHIEIGDLMKARDFHQENAQKLQDFIQNSCSW